MSDPVAPLVLDLLEWLAAEPRSYRDVLDAWRTSCPRLPIWETANEQGLLEHHHSPGSEALVALSAKGRAHLHQARPAVRARDSKAA
jgi:hypothetical protein